MKITYIKIFMMWLIVLTNFSIKAQTTREADSLTLQGSSSSCEVANPSGGFIEGIACNEANSEIAANDIVVPADSNLTLNGIMANMILEEGETITSAKIWIFADEFGYPYMYPGYEVTSQVVTSTSQTLVGSDNGMDFYEVEWDLSPIILEGRSDYTTRYWVGISATTTNGSTPFWEVTTDDMIGQPAMYSTGSWFAMYHFSQDGTYIFYAECEPLDPGGGTNDCGSEIANGGFVEGIACNEANSEIAANDIVVPADSNLTLNGIMANMILEEGETITSAKIWIFADEFGYPYMYPGYEVTSQVVTSTSQTLVGSDNGMDFYEVEWDLSPIILEGRSDYTTRYWVGISATTTNGSTPFWEVTTDDMIGQPAMYSTGSWFAMYHFSQDGTYIFYAECGPLDPGGGGDPGNDPGETCDVSLETDINFVGEGINCIYSGHSNTRYAANDLIVTQGTDKVLTAIKPSLILNAGVTIDGVQVRIYKDDHGLPGEEINEQWVGVTSMDLRTSFDDKEVYEALIDLEPVFLRGYEDVDTVYWVGIAVSTSDSSVPYWEVTYENSLGHPSALNTGANYSSPNPDQDGVYTFYATCYEIDGNNGPNEGYCDYSFLDINQNEDSICFGMVSDGGMFQSFTATEVESAGAGIKLTDPSRGLEVTLSLWDGLSNQGGTMLASQTTYTYGDRWVDVFWEEAVELEIGSEYFIRVEGDNDLSCIRAAQNPYPGGQAYSMFNAYPDYDYTFRTYYCNDIGCVQMDYGNTGYFQNSTLTSKDQDNLLATDISVPVGEHFTIDKLRVYVWVLPGANINDADIVFYQDDNGSPGEIIRTDQNIVPTTTNYLGTGYGYDWYEVDFEVAPLFLSGKVESISTYWVSLNIGTNIGSAYMSLSSSIIMGYESYNSPDNGTTWEVIEGWETKYEFSGVCEIIEINPCELPELAIDLSVGVECISNVGDGVAQSFTATVGASAGAGVKFLAPSNSFNATISLWDNLPNQEGNMLATKTVQTVGENWVEVFWDQVIPLEIDEVYYIVIHGDSGLPCLSGSTEDVYPGGHMYGTNYTPFPDFDLNFRVYGCHVEDPAGDCEEENPNDFTFETGANASTSSNYRAANDITVEAGQSFRLTQVLATVISNFPIMEADIYYFNDDAGFPADEIGSETGVPVISQRLLGQRETMDVYEVTLNVAPFLFEGQIDDTATYWINIQFKDLGGTTEVYWMVTSSTAVGNPVASSESGGEWHHVDPIYDGVYTWISECEDVLSIDAMTQHEFSFYPNPTKGELNLKSNEHMEKVALYNLLGQKVLEYDINASSFSIDVSRLASGAYLMKVSINGQVGTYKVLKQ